jgi:hypothetical protein
MHNEIELVVGVQGAAPLVAGVRLDLRRGLLDDGGDVLVLDEQQDRGLGVAPDQVLEDLPERLVHGARPAPDLALADEDVAVLDADDDVGLALTVEDLAGGITLEMRVEVDQQQVADLFLIELGR